MILLLTYLLYFIEFQWMLLMHIYELYVDSYVLCLGIL